MKPSFHTRLINGPFKDPGLYVRLLREGRAFLFDIGSTDSLSARDLLKTTHIFVSHTHIDHFIGFDNMLRVCLGREKKMSLYGPEGFIDCVAGRLKGYTWNLTGDYPLEIEAFEVTEASVRSTVFRAKNAFQPEIKAPQPFTGGLLKDSGVTVSAVILDHQIPCLAFSMEEDYHINIDKALLGRLDLPVGPWLNELKSAIRSGKADSKFHLNGRQYSFSELKDIAAITRGQKLSYVVDAVGSEQNINAIVTLVRGSDTLFIETYFLDADRERAHDRYHLTAQVAGQIAREAGVGKMEPMHFSPKYSENSDLLIQEAEKAFRGE